MKRLVYASLLITLVLLIGTVDAKMSANFPVADDPEKMEYSISAASDGTKYLVALMEQPQPDFWSLYAQFVNLDGTLGNKVPIVENSLIWLTDAKVAYGGGKYLYIWVERGSTYTSIKGIFIDPNGTKGSIFTIVSGIPSDYDSAVAFGANKFLVAYDKPFTSGEETHRAVYGKLIDLNGNMSDEFKISSLWGAVDFQNIAFDGSKFLVIYRDDKDDNRILARVVSPTDGPILDELIIDNNILPSDNPIAIFFDGEKYLVVWTDQTQQYPNVWQFYGKFINFDLTQSDPFTITTVNSHKIAPFIAFDGTKYLITWNDGRNCGFIPLGDDEVDISCIRTGYDMYGRYFSKKGKPLGGEFVVSKLSGNDVGGFMGRAIGGKVLGIINKGVSFFEEFSAEDLDGKFWISAGYDIFAPDKKEKLMAGGPYKIRWKAPAQAVKFDIYYSNDNGASWTLIKSGHTSKALNWAVPPQDGRKPNCKIKIEAYDSSNNKLTTFYSRVFSIEVAKIIQPNGGELLTSGHTYKVKWQTQGLNTTVAKTVIQYSTDGRTWKTIITIDGNLGEIDWTVPTVTEIKPTCLLRVIFKDAGGKNIAITESEAVFTISPIS